MICSQLSWHSYRIHLHCQYHGMLYYSSTSFLQLYTDNSIVPRQVTSIYKLHWNLRFQSDNLVLPPAHSWVTNWFPCDLHIMLMLHDCYTMVSQTTGKSTWLIQGNNHIFITGPLWGESTSHWWFPSQRVGNPPVTDGFSSQRASNVEIISMSW